MRLDLKEAMGRGGINNWSDLARKAQVDDGNLRNALAGRRGLSFAACKRIADALPGDENPLGLYVGSQIQAIEKADLSPAEKSAAVSTVMKKVEASPQLHDDDDAELVDVLRDLLKLGAEALARMEPKEKEEEEEEDKPKTAKKSRDFDGRARSEPGKLGVRDIHGRRIK